MLSRVCFYALFALVVVGCVDGEPVEFACPSIATDGGTIPTDSGDGGNVNSDGGPCPSPDPIDVCDVDLEGDITNMLDGTCWWEQCRDGERSLFSKPAGVPCVYRGSNGDFAVGSCNVFGECADNTATSQSLAPADGDADPQRH